MEEPHDCLRRMLLKELGQQFATQDCKKSCSNCKRRQGGAILTFDASNFAKILIKIAESNSKFLTVIKLIDAIKKRDSKPSGVDEQEYKEFKEFTKNEGNVRRLANKLLLDGMFYEEFKIFGQNVCVNLKVNRARIKDLHDGFYNIELTKEPKRVLVPAARKSSQQPPPQKPRLSLVDGAPALQTYSGASARQQQVRASFQRSYKMQEVENSDLLELFANSQEFKPAPAPRQEPVSFVSQNPVSTFSGSKKGRKSTYEMSAMPHNNLDQFLGVAPSAPKKQPPPPVEEEYEAVLEIEADQNYTALTTTGLRSLHRTTSPSQNGISETIRREAVQNEEKMNIQFFRDRVMGALKKCCEIIFAKAVTQEFAYLQAIPTTFSDSFLESLVAVSIREKDVLKYLPLTADELKPLLQKKSKEDLTVVDCYGHLLLDTIRETMVNLVSRKVIYACKERQWELEALKRVMTGLLGEVEEQLEELEKM